MGVRISERAVSRIVAGAAASVPGTTELARSLAGRTYPRYDVIVDDAAGTCSVEAFIAVVWPSPVLRVPNGKVMLREVSRTNTTRDPVTGIPKNVADLVRFGPSSGASRSRRCARRAPRP